MRLQSISPSSPCTKPNPPPQHPASSPGCQRGLAGWERCCWQPHSSRRGELRPRAVPWGWEVGWVSSRAPTHPPIRRICEATNSPLGGTRSPHPLATTKSSRFQAGAVQGCAKRGQPACSCQGRIPKAGSMPEVRAAPARKPSPVQRIPVCQGHPWVQGAPGGARAGTGPVAVLAGSTGPGGGRAAGPPRSRLLQMAKAIRAALARTEP